MGLSFEKIMLLLVLAAIIIGPDRLPEYTAKFANLVRAVRNFAGDAKSQLKAEMGEDFDRVDWKQYDPRQYDPRRIIQDVLAEEKRQETKAKAQERVAALPKITQIDPTGNPVAAVSSVALNTEAYSGETAIESGKITVPFDSEAT